MDSIPPPPMPTINAALQTTQKFGANNMTRQPMVIKTHAPSRLLRFPIRSDAVPPRKHIAEKLKNCTGYAHCTNTASRMPNCSPICLPTAASRFAVMANATRLINDVHVVRPRRSFPLFIMAPFCPIDSSPSPRNPSVRRNSPSTPSAAVCRTRAVRAAWPPPRNSPETPGIEG